MDGYVLDTASIGGCSDTFAAVGQSGVNPPSICGTNTGYHMYVEFGTQSSDTVVLTHTWAAAALTTAKTYNILARQICCTDSWKYALSFNRTLIVYLSTSRGPPKNVSHHMP